ncbi:bifunctional sulfate adenylyltransferase/adenylylsulfate kinase [Kangiella sp. TOML190]|uniref:bifunctional sulfate adenylyltransferase/adenylylsulfate kinase n=1 Tax=Kangiella sp. TOML190 TaxID=2931351 RepID=UPI00203D995E|nr:bifunctional sulfate adenylyltransferase/adenylylsulfate kinase [Kangiella sp. TOML190]
MTTLNPPYGGELVNLVDSQQTDFLREKANDLLSIDLNLRQECDLELLLNGAFSPLQGFMNHKQYQSVLEHGTLTDGLLWPIPITLDIPQKLADQIQLEDEVALRDREGLLVAILTVEDKWLADKALEARQVYVTTDDTHPGVDYLFNQAGKVYLGGKLVGIELPNHYDYQALRDTPFELRQKFHRLGWNKVVAFQTRNPIHKAHQELTFRAAKDNQANLLIQPVVGMTKSGDIDHFSRVRCYEKVLPYFPEQTTCLSLLPLAMRMAGPKEALLHAIIRKNYGCSHIIIGRDHAGPGNDSNGKPFYGAYEAQDLMLQYQSTLGIQMVPFKEMAYVQEKAQFMPIDEISSNMTVLDISGTELRRRLKEGLAIPDWFSFPEVIEELRKNRPSKDKQGFTVFFTGLSGSGKSTIANALMIKLLELGERPVTLLDGDIVRKNLSSELGFSKEHRNLNIERIGFVASEITKNGGIAICAPIAPYKITRRKVKQMISPLGGFIEVYVSTSLEVCEARDRKGLYAKARKGLIKEFTGIDDPYELPVSPDLNIDTQEVSADLAAQQIILKLEQLGYIK